jgi:glycogen phosphorylase
MLAFLPDKMSTSDEAPDRHIAYFSMEIALEEAIPTYAGGLGVLAGDMLRSCADLRVPVVAVSLLHRKGYFRQEINEDGWQRETPAAWKPEELLERQPGSCVVEIEGRRVHIAVWQYNVVGRDGYRVPVLLLDTNHPENGEADRQLTDYLYGDGDNYRIAQEIVLGIGGVRALTALGYDGVRIFHLNEGHAAFAALELVRREHERTGSWDLEGTRARCVFTTHTPVPAGHDQFDHGLVSRTLGELVPWPLLRQLGGEDRLNMTRLALSLSRYVNGVARSHAHQAEHLFPGRHIAHITNGVHSPSWTCASFAALYDHHVPGWQDDPAMLRQALAIPPEQVWAAHALAKAKLLDEVARRTGVALRADALTIGFARRSTAYKRGDLVFRDLERLRGIGIGRLQIVFGGKAHPRDHDGKRLIQHIVRCARDLGADVPVVYLPEYDVDLARLVVSGVDLWLNTPLRPLEASGTSGMKAAHNGVPSLSVLDGWWLEGWVEGATGWSVGGAFDPDAPPGTTDDQDAADLYRKLENVVLPLYFENRPRWISVMQHAVALNASFFNTHRMVQQYLANAYLV